MISDVYTFDINWYEPQLEVQVPAGNEGHKEGSNYVPFECKVFCRYCKYVKICF